MPKKSHHLFFRAANKVENKLLVSEFHTEAGNMFLSQTSQGFRTKCQNNKIFLSKGFTKHVSSRQISFMSKCRSLLMPICVILLILGTDDSVPRAGSLVQSGATHMPILAWDQIPAWILPVFAPCAPQQSGGIVLKNVDRSVGKTWCKLNQGGNFFLFFVICHADSSKAGHQVMILVSLKTWNSLCPNLKSN